MINLKAKMRIRLAVKDYQQMFPEEYAAILIQVQTNRENLKTEFAEVMATHVIKRGLFEIPEKLGQMIALKLSDNERAEMAEKDNARWFAKEFPQFRLSKTI